MMKAVTSTFSRLYVYIQWNVLLKTNIKKCKFKNNVRLEQEVSMDNILVLKERRRLSVVQETHLLFINLSNAYVRFPSKITFENT